MTTPPSPLVIVRCSSPKCRAVLGSLDVMPQDWSGTLNILRCRKCVIPRPRRLLRVLASQNATGFALTADIALADLRRAAEKAVRSGHAESVEVNPFRSAE
jgi:hypothetical protein